MSGPAEESRLACSILPLRNPRPPFRAVRIQIPRQNARAGTHVRIVCPRTHSCVDNPPDRTPGRINVTVSADFSHNPGTSCPSRKGPATVYSCLLISISVLLPPLPDGIQATTRHPCPSRMLGIVREKRRTRRSLFLCRAAACSCVCREAPFPISQCALPQ